MVVICAIQDVVGCDDAGGVIVTVNALPGLAQMAYKCKAELSSATLQRVYIVHVTCACIQHNDCATSTSAYVEFTRGVAIVGAKRKNEGMRNKRRTN